MLAKRKKEQAPALKNRSGKACLAAFAARATLEAMSFQTWRSLSIALCALVLGLSSARGAAAIRTITKLPYKITQPGSYQLGKNLNFAGSPYAITVEADDVTIDLRGFRITSTGEISKNVETAAIFANAKRNLVIKNGTVQGFFRGIYLESGDLTIGGQVVENMRVLQSTFLGIQVKGRGAVVRHCQVHTVKGSIVYQLIRYGIDVQGSCAIIAGNEVQDVFPGTDVTNSAFGIRLLNGTHGVIRENRVLTSFDAESSTRIGIYTNSGAGIVERNFVSRAGTGILLDGATNTVYRDNTVAGANTRYTNVSGAATDGDGNK